MFLLLRKNRHDSCILAVFRSMIFLKYLLRIQKISAGGKNTTFFHIKFFDKYISRRELKQTRDLTNRE